MLKDRGAYRPIFARRFGKNAIPEAIAAGSPMPILTAGHAAYGGLIAGIVVPALCLRKKGASVRAFFDCATLVMGALFAFVRVGCFLEGCDFGRPTSSWLGVRFPAGSPAAEMHASLGWIPDAPASLPVHATEVYDAALGVLASALVLSTGCHRKDVTLCEPLAPAGRPLDHPWVQGFLFAAKCIRA